jgi:hypothetical protein
MIEHGQSQNSNQEPNNEREQRRQRELMDGTNLLPEILKERMPALYSQEQEPDPEVVCKFFDPAGSWTWYATEGSPVDEDGYYDTNKPKVDYLFFGLVVGFEKELGYFSLNELKSQDVATGIPVNSSYLFPFPRHEVISNGCTQWPVTPPR